MLRAPLAGLRRLRPVLALSSRAGSSHAAEGAHHDAGHLSAGAAAYEKQLPHLWGATVRLCVCSAAFWRRLVGGARAVFGFEGGEEGGRERGLRLNSAGALYAPAAKRPVPARLWRLALTAHHPRPPAGAPPRRKT